VLGKHYTSELYLQRSPFQNELNLEILLDLEVLQT
jgi:hypothetical protein